MTSNRISQKLIYTTLFTALIGASCFIQIPLPGGVPIVLQDMLSILSGLFLGPLYGGLSVLLFLFLGCLGLPVFSGKAGLQILLYAPTGGFLIGYLFASIIGGFIYYLFNRLNKKPSILYKIITTILVVFVAFTLIFTIGIFGFIRITNTSINKAITLIFLPFIPGTIIKTILLTLLTINSPTQKIQQNNINKKRIDPSVSTSHFIPTEASSINIYNLSKTFENGICALNNISLQIDKGSFTVIGGANGSGKSVLMSLIAQLDEPTSGEILFSSKECRVGLVFQDADAQLIGETPLEDINFGLRNLGYNKDTIDVITQEILSEFELLHKANSSSRMLSGGEKRKLALASILVMQPNIIIFDEPFANLDYPGVQQVCKILEQLKTQQKTVIVLTHELEKVLALADRLIVLYKGAKVFDDTPDVGLLTNLEIWGVKNPLSTYTTLRDCLWSSNK